MNLGLKLEDVREEVLNLLGHGLEGTEVGERGAGPSGKSGKSKTPALDSFGRDLTELARQNKLDPVIGRESEIERVIQILCRRQKNNPVLLGEAGVGKTAIVEGFAQMVVDGSIPEPLADKRIVVLDLAMMVAGTKYRGQFEERYGASPAILLANHSRIGVAYAKSCFEITSMADPLSRTGPNIKKFVSPIARIAPA